MTDMTLGTPFSGQRLPPVDIPVNILSNSGIICSGNSGTSIPVGTTFNVAQYSSLKCVFFSDSAGTTQFFRVNFKWFINPDFTGQVMEESFTFHSFNTVMYGQVLAHAPYLQIDFFNYDNVTANMTARIFGSTRVIPRSQFHTWNLLDTIGKGTDNVLAADSVTVASGTTQDYGPINFYNGPAIARFRVTDSSTIGANLIQAQINAQPGSAFTAASHLQWNFPANGGIAARFQPIVNLIILPRRVCNIAITNSDTVSHTVGFTVFAQEI